MSWLQEWFPEVITQSDLTIERAQRLARLLAQEEYSAATLVEIRRHPGSGAVCIVANLLVERGQITLVADIRRNEPIAIVFSSNVRLPSALAMRADFPNVPHLNLVPLGEPASLCLYQNQEEADRQWTAIGFVERIRWWLSETAHGALHAEEQPLEPLFFASYETIVIPRSLNKGNPGDVNQHSVSAFVTDDENAPICFISGDKDERGTKFSFLIMTTNYHTHGRIQGAPKNIGELTILINEYGLNVGSELKREIFRIIDHEDDLLPSRIVVIVRIPIRRSEDGPVESIQIKAFVIVDSVSEVGETMGLIAPSPNKIGGKQFARLLVQEEAVDLSSIQMSPCEIALDLDSELLSEVSGTSPIFNGQILLIGAGAVGSHIADSLGRQGFGRWEVLDKDWILPHNLARHTLSPAYVGYSKARALASHLDKLRGNDDTTKALHASVYNSDGSIPIEITDALGRADLVIDASASVKVSRIIAHDCSGVSRRVSIFLNPRGTGSVMLAESKNRSCRLDVLEHEYLRSICIEEDLRDHLGLPNEGERFAGACREPSVRIAESNVSLLTGAAALTVSQLPNRDQSFVRIWDLDEGSGRTKAYYFDVDPPLVAKVGDWKIHLLSSAARDMQAFRADGLPNETGGIIIGSIDRDRKFIYIAHVLQAPPDSKGTPGGFLRGVAMLQEKVQEIGRRSLSNLGYLGEWHSHTGRATNPSDEDKVQLGWVAEELQLHDSPGIILIAGEECIPSALVGQTC